MALDTFVQLCGGDDDYACLRSFRENPDQITFVDFESFAKHFKKYEHDRNNFSLYIWGYVMPLKEYYKANNMVLSVTGEITKNGQRTVYGEPDVCPQFEENIL